MPIGIDHKDFLKKGTIDEIVYEKCSHLLMILKLLFQQKNDVLIKLKKIFLKILQKIFFGKIIVIKKYKVLFIR